MTLATGTGSEVQRVRIAPPPSIAKGDRPQTINLHRSAFDGIQRAFEFMFNGVESHDCAIAKITDEKLPSMDTKRVRRHRDTPWRIHRAHVPVSNTRSSRKPGEGARQ